MSNNTQLQPPPPPPRPDANEAVKPPPRPSRNPSSNPDFVLPQLPVTSPRPPARPQPSVPPPRQPALPRPRDVHGAPRPSASPGETTGKSTYWIFVVLLLGIAGGGWWWTERQSSPSRISGAEPATLDGESPTLAAGEGAVLIEGRPWGRIEAVLDTETSETVELPPGSPFTPRRVALPAGIYGVRLSHPDGADQSCEVTVNEGATAICAVRFVETDPDVFLQELGWP